MVKPREKKTNRGEIPQELYEQAANAVINEKAKVRTTARQYGICHVSLRRFIIAKKNQENPQVGYRPHNKVFTSAQEQQLCNYCRSCSKLYFGLAPKDLPITPKNINSGFRCSRIWPLNRNIFTEDEFAPSNVTDNPIGINLPGEAVNHPQPSTSATPSTPPGPLNTETLLPAAPTKTYYTPEQVRPFPKADFSKQKNTKPRQKGKTAIITDTPERTLIEKRIREK
ncbi:hypothetical protein MML48_1g00097 [Holotrichia oblita]|uniref:Uncharacterized protein n=1 Tax=Holotrichia oblita TaxID=644536 RepID=A0ACB9TRG4_HOLOL|nr:hypothetical protein MML48_1g00097 [Holotrichia oblita]